MQDNQISGYLEQDGAPRVEGTAWNGAVFNGLFRCPKKRHTEFRVKVHVKDVKAHVDDAGTGSGLARWTFALELDVGTKRVPACYEKDDRAVPIAGFWNQQSDYHPGDAFSFSCQSAGAFKCLERGFRSERVVGGASPRVELFEACTRMMRADYCGNGISFTKKGSLVSVWDNTSAPKSSDPSKPDELTFEAAWTSTGAICGNHNRWPITIDEFMPADVQERTQYRRCLAVLDSKTAMPRCEDQRSAEALAEGRPLVLNKSCPKHHASPALLCSDEEDPKVARNAAVVRNH